jgi:hypothetical protein
MAWIIERLLEKSNFITELITKVSHYSIWLLIVLVFGAVFGYFLENNKNGVQID